MRRPALWVLIGLVAVSLVGNILYQRALQRSHERYSALARQLIGLPAAVLTPRAEALPAAADTALAAVSGLAAAAPGAAAPGATAAPNAAPAPAGTATVAAAGKAKANPVESIQATYGPRIQTIQQDCESRLSDLLNAAKATYDRQQTAGGADLAGLFRTYGPQLDGLRKLCDGWVETMLEQLSADLKSAGLPQDLVGEVRKAYQAQVAQRQAEILARVTQ